MQKMKSICATVAIAILGGLAPAYGAITTYSFYYEPGKSAYTVAAGGSLSVPVYLEEVNSDQSTNSLLKSEDGVSAAGVNVSYFSGATGTTLTGATANTGAVPNGFDDPTSAGTVNSVSSATITESTDPPPFGTDTVGVEAGPPANGVSEVYLGTFTIHAGSSPGQTTVFSAGVADPANGTTFTNDDNYDLDNNADPFNPTGSSSLYFSAAASNFSVTTTSVPEPAPLFVSMISGLMLMRRRFISANGKLRLQAVSLAK